MLVYLSITDSTSVGDYNFLWAVISLKPCIGGVKVILDVGWYRDELNTDIKDVDLTNGQQHVVSVRRRNRGRTLIVQVR